MARLSESLLVQWVDDVGVVLVNESGGDEIVIPKEQVEELTKVLEYFRPQWEAA